jgi:hypothetical protein
MSTRSADPGGKCDTATVVVKTEECKQAMEKVVMSLSAVMGGDEQAMLGELEDSLTALSGSEMKRVASSMAKAALETTRHTCNVR